MRRLQRWASALLLILGCTLILVGVGLWARQSLIPAWHFRSLDTPFGRGDGVVVAAKLEATPERRSSAATKTPRPTRGTSVSPTENIAATITTATNSVQTPRPSSTRRQSTPSPTETATPAGPPPATKPPSRLVIPAIDLDTEVVPMGWEVKQTSNGESYSEWVLPKDEAGWHENSALLENAQFMAQTDDERLTLITCWPYETNTHRLILIARPVVQ